MCSLLLPCGPQELNSGPRLDGRQLYLLIQPFHRPLSWFVFGNKVRLCIPGCPITHYVEQASLKLTETHLPSAELLKCWNQRCGPPHPAECRTFCCFPGSALTETSRPFQKVLWELRRSSSSQTTLRSVPSTHGSVTEGFPWNGVALPHFSPGSSHHAGS